MKTLFNLLGLILIFFTASLVMMPLDVMAQVVSDSTSAAASAGSDLSNLLESVPLPMWLTKVIAITILVLPFIQYVLKLLPTENSIRFKGLLGKVLDFLTAFQKDRRTGGGTHK